MLKELSHWLSAKSIWEDIILQAAKVCFQSKQRQEARDWILAKAKRN
jgi:hypothetical protein